MLHNAAFHLGLLCLLRQNPSSEKEIQYLFSEIITCDTLIFTMDLDLWKIPLDLKGLIKLIYQLTFTISYISWSLIICSPVRSIIAGFTMDLALWNIPLDLKGLIKLFYRLTFTISFISWSFIICSPVRSITARFTLCLPFLILVGTNRAFLTGVSYIIKFFTSLARLCKILSN